VSASNTKGKEFSLWPTPTKGMHKQDVNDNGEYARRVKESGFQVMLPAFVKLYPTPRRSDYKDCGDKGTKSQIYMKNKKYLCGVVKENQKKPGGKLNPKFCEVLMGFPMNWTQITPTD
jgi:hypothetical protein